MHFILDAILKASKSFHLSAAQSAFTR